MAYQNICNICGANYEYVNGRWICPACGAYKAEELSNEEVTLLYNAAQKLRLADFDAAEQEYADIVQKYPLNHEGYWGRLLSKYGIKYEEDFDGKKIPTCYATTIESLLNDSDYKRATELAPPDVREYYARQAEYIERVRKEWVSKASHEAPYDVFICYKDSDLANGIDRTQDSIAAQELYIHLIEQGYRVFFSRESLRDKVGEKYEPYIFNALSTAKVMLVYGTNPEFITSTWLKNEWTRYHKRILAGDKKQGSLVTICDGFSPSELPRLLAATQCFDATKRSFYSDLDKYVKKYTAEEAKPAPVAAPAPEAGAEASAAEVVVVPKKKPLTTRQKTAIGVAAVSVLIAVLMVILIPILTRDPALDSFSVKEGAGGMTFISGYSGDGNIVKIPSTIDGGRVIGIDARAFDSMDNLTSIEIPESVTTIGANAFYGCTSVKTIVIPDSVTSMGMSAFYGWTKDQTIIIEGKDAAPSGWNAKWADGCEATIIYGKFYVTFDANGGRGKVQDIHTEIDSKITLPDGKDFTRAGYTFAGWSLEKNATYAEYQGNTVYTVGRPQGLVFYAVWTPLKNTIVYNANGGEGSMASTEVYSDARVTLPTCTFIRDGYDFIGWSTSSSSTSVKYSNRQSFVYGTASKTTLYAVWEAKPRNVYLYPNGGVGDIQTYFDVRVGEIVFLQKGYFTRQGYTFAGYTESPDGSLMYPNGGDYIVPEGQGDIILYACWTPRNYNIRFHAENGTITTVQVPFETEVDLPDPGFKREGYKLIGWTTNDKGEDVTVDYAVNGKYTHKALGVINLYPVWAPEEYKVTFYANHPSAAGSMQPIQIAIGGEAKLPTCTFAYEGYMLDGWATSPDGAPIYDPEGLFKMTTVGDKVLYAVWKELEYTVHYELGNHGVNHAENPTFYRESDGLITLKAPTREGYEFVGWFSDANRTVACDSIAADSKGELTFYAKWNALPNTAIFDANGGNGSMSSVTADTDTVITLPLNTFTREDCTFMGWTTVLGSDVVEYADGAEFTMQSHGITLHAVWKAVSYTITYDFAGGELVGAITEYSHLTNSFTLGTPLREGYEFIGWSGTGIEGIQRTVMIPIGSKGDRSFTAHWQAGTYEIQFRPSNQGVEGTMTALSATTGEVVTLPQNAFVSYGYKFVGWKTQGSTEVLYTDGQTITMTPSDLILYAVWELQTSGLVFEYDSVVGYTGSATEVIIPTYYNKYEIRSISAGAFRDKTHITSISIPSQVDYIGENAFAGCTSLSTIHYEGMAGSISLSAFLNTAYYLDSANRVGGVFYFEGHLIAAIDLTIGGNYVIPSGTKVIAADAFKNCSNLVTVFIPSSVTYVGSNAFQNCTSLTIRYEDPSIPSMWASDWNSSLRPVVLGYHEEYTDAYGVQYKLYPDGSAVVVGYTGSATELTLSLQGYTVRKIADGAFQNNGTLTKVIFAPGLVEIEANAFAGCYNLVEIVLPEGIEKIGAYAFDNCQRLTTITATGEASQLLKNSAVTPIKNFPSTLTYIGQYAFYRCDSLEVVFIPTSIKTISYGVFSSCDKLTVYAQPTSQPSGWDWFEATTKWGVDGVYRDAQDVVYALYADGTAKVTDYLGSASTVVIGLNGYTVTEIGENAFYDCDTLISITVPEGVTKIENQAFANCSKLETIVLPATLKTIGDRICISCISLMQINLPEGLTEIGESAFNCCTVLTEITLPSTLKTVGDSAFEQCQALQSVVLPASIERMGNDVFHGIWSETFVIYARVSAQPSAWGLQWNRKSYGAYGENYYYTTVWNYNKVLTANNGVTYIITNDNKAYAVSYEGDANVLDISLNGYIVVEIEPYAFAGCTTLQKIVLPEGLEKIGKFAFDGCTALAEINLPTSLKTVCDHAFQSCNALQVIDIPANVETIEEYAFWNCNSLTIYVSAASKPTGWSASWNNENRPVVWDVKEHLTADNGVIYIIRNDNTVVVSGYTGEPTELDLTLEGYTVTEIADMAFYNCDTLTKVVIPNTVTKIGTSAFCSCENLVSVKLSTALTEIGEQAFGSCGKLSDITLPEGLIRIGAYAFEHCHSLVGVILPGTVTTIYQYAFRNCSRLANVYIPASVTQINSDVFAECYALSIYAAAESKPNNWNSFWNNYNRPVTWGVAGVHLDDQGVTYILNSDGTATVAKYTGEGEEITLSVEGYTVTKIADNVFEGNQTLKRVNLLDGMLEIGYRAFFEASYLESINLPDSITTIGAQAFCSCVRLSGVQLPASLTTLGYEAFYCCESLTEINIPKGLTKLESMTFYTCNKLTTVTFEEGSVLSEIGTSAFAGCVCLASINLPTSLRVIGENSFCDCDRLTEIAIPEGVTTIQQSAFCSCEQLVSVTLPRTLTTIGDGAFSNCSNLKTLEFAEGVQSIGKEAFRYCYALKSVTFPNTLRSIGEYAFGSCNNLRMVYIPASVTEIDQYAFLDCYSLKIYAAAASEPATWDSFWNYNGCSIVWSVAGIVIDEQGIVYQLMSDNTAIVIGYSDKGVSNLVIGLEGYTVTEIAAGVFANAFTVNTVVIPEGVVKIGTEAFYQCSYLTSVTFPTTLTTIGERAFSNVNWLRCVYIPANVTTIENDAFSNWDGGINIFCKVLDVARPATWDGNCFVNANVYYGVDAIYTDDQGLIYQLFTADRTAKLIGCTTAKESYVIPTTVNGYAVTAIGQNILKFNGTVKRITIPASIVTIEQGAFVDCYYLIVMTELTAKPDGWTDNWMTNCLGVAWGTTTVYVDEQGVGYALYSDNTAKVIGCSDGLTSITIPATVNGYAVTEIADRAFQNRSMITSITLPSGLLKIGDYAFASVHSLKSITLPDTLTHIGTYAFAYCNGTWKTVFIPASVTTIGAYAFYDVGLSDIYTAHTTKPEGWHVDWNPDNYSVAWNYAGFVTDSQGVTYLLHPDMTASVYSYNGNATELTFYVEGYTIVEICDNVFYGANRGLITKVTFPSTLKKIGANAFYNCTSLTSIELPDGIEVIGSQAFTHCNGMTMNELTIPSSIQSIGSSAFAFCNIQTIYVQCPEKTDWNSDWSNGVSNVYWNYKDIYTDAQGVTYVLHLDNTATVWSYEGSATTLTFAVEGYTVTKIRERVFQNNTTLTAVTLPEGLLEIGAYAFSQCSNLQSITIPAGVTKIASHAFYYCTKLQSVTLNGVVSVIEDRAFFECQNLQSINLPEGLTTIGEYAFYWCTKLQSIDLPDSLTTIETFAFYSCSSLESFTIPANVTAIGHAAFHSIAADKIYVGRAEATENYASGWHNKNDSSIVWNFKALYTDAQGITYALFNDNTAHAISYSGNATEITFAVEGYTVTRLARTLFSTSAARTITKVTLPDGLLEIETYALSGLTAVQELCIPASVTTIGYGAIQLGKEATVYVVAAERPSGWDEQWTSNSMGAYGPIYAHNVIWNFKSTYVDTTYGITYVLRNDNTAIAVSFDGSVQEVVIGIDGYTVVALGRNLFQNRTMLKKVTLPTGVLEIGDHAFDGCQRLNTLSLPTTLQTIGNYAFTDCFGLTTLSFANGLVRVGDYAFSNCTGLTSVTLPDSVTYIGAYAFKGCIKLTSMDLPEGITAIAVCCFENCTALTTVSFPSGLQSIGASAFNGCTKLAQVTLPAGLTNIDNGVFNNCDSLTEVEIPEGVTLIDSMAFSDCDLLQTVKLPSTLQTIGYHAFAECDRLTNVMLPEGLTTINEYAFQNCPVLGTITIPESVVTIGYDAFWGCGDVLIICRAVSRPSGWNYSWAPSSVTVIWNAKAVVETENGMTFIIRNDDTAALISYTGNATELDVVLEGYTVTEIGNSVFQDNTTLTSVTIHEGVKVIGANAFYGCTKLATLTLPTTLQTIGQQAFRNCYVIMQIEIPEGVTEIPAFAFEGCDLLKNVALPNTLTAIRMYAFEGCKSLESVIIPESVTVIESQAFVNCFKLTAFARALAKPSGWSSEWVYDAAVVVWDFKELVEQDGVTYALRNDNTAVVLSYSGNAEEVTLGQSITHGEEVYTLTEIARKAFYQNETLTKIVIPEGIEIIGAYAFYGCSNLKDVVLPSTLKTVKDNAFAYSGIESIEIKEGLLTIEQYAFQSTELTTLTLPEGLQTIGYWAFGNCGSLTFVYIPESVVTIESNAFANAYRLKNACVSALSKPGGWNSDWMYSGTAVVWNVKEVLEQDGVTYALLHDGTAIAIDYSGSAQELTLGVQGYTLTEIGESVFNDCDTLKTVYVPEGVTTIGAYAFSACDLLSNVNLPSTLTEIRERAFESCHNLCEIIIPASVTHVGTYALLTNANRVIIYAGGAASGADTWSYGWKHDSTQVVWNFKEFTTVNDITYALCNDQTAVVVRYSGTAEELTLALEGYTVTEILGYAFADNNYLKKVVIPQGVRIIGPQTFYNCTALTDVSLPSSLEMIGPYAFFSTPLKYIVLQDGLMEIGEYAFYGSALRALFIPSTVTRIGERAFQNNALNCVYIPSSVTYTGEYAFENNPELHIYLGDAEPPTSWGYYWHGGVNSTVHYVAQVVMDSQGVMYQMLENNTASVIGFQYNGTNEIVIGLEGYTVTSIGRYAFSYAPITSVVIPEGVRVIAGLAFAHCESLSSVSLPSTLNSIYTEAFSDCHALAEVVIPMSVTLIESWAFYSGNGMKFYAEVAEKPDQWQDFWCSGNYEIDYGYTPAPTNQT